MLVNTILWTRPVLTRNPAMFSNVERLNSAFIEVKRDLPGAIPVDKGFDPFPDGCGNWDTHLHDPRG